MIEVFCDFAQSVEDIGTVPTAASFRVLSSSLRVTFINRTVIRRYKLLTPSFSKRKINSE